MAIYLKKSEINHELRELPINMANFMGLIYIKIKNLVTL